MANNPTLLALALCYHGLGSKRRARIKLDLAPPKGRIDAAIAVAEVTSALNRWHYAQP